MGEEDYQALWGDPGSSTSPGLGRVGGAHALERIRRTRRQRPDVVVVAHEKSARADLGTLAGESWSWAQHCERKVLPHVKTFRTLQRVLAAVAGALDEGRTHGLECQNAYLHHLYRCLEHAAKDPGHELGYAFPILGIDDPGAPRPRTGWASLEHGALAAYHKEEHLLDQARRSFASGGKGGDQAAGAPGTGMEQAIKEAVAAEFRRRGKGKEGENGKGKDPKGEGKVGGAGRPNA